MKFVKSSVWCGSLGAVLVLELAASPSAHASIWSRFFSATHAPPQANSSQPQRQIQRQPQLKQSNPPPPPTNPSSSAPGGRRNPSTCPQDVGTAASPSLGPEVGSETSPAKLTPALTALSPPDSLGLTVAERPTFLIYVPKTSAESAEFSLRDQASHGLYRTTVALKNTPSIISITLPEQATPLAIGQQYTWTFSVICDPTDRLTDQFVTAPIQRIDLNATRDLQISQAAVSDRPMLYQQDGLWYDAIALLLDLRRSQPQNASLTTAWRELLQSGGIDTAIDSNPAP